MDFHVPHPMATGGTFGVYLVSDALDPRRRRGLDRGIDQLARSGFRSILSSNVALNEGYAAGPTHTRTTALRELVRNPQVNGFLSGWGGKSTIDLFVTDGFSANDMVSDSRPWFGFSDACVLLNAVTFSTGLVTFYGPQVAGKLDETMHAHFNAGMYRRGWPVFGATSENAWHPVSGGSCSGLLIGGNLSSFTLAYLAGAVPPVTGSEHSFVFFFEAGDEDPRVLRQLVVSLAISDFFGNVTGVVVGDLGRSRDATEYLMTALREVCGPSTVLASCPTFGHANLENAPLPIGLRVDIIAGSVPRTRCSYFG